MTTVFIGGSRAITTIAAVIRPRLDTIIARGHAVVVGDADGADACVQQYLAKQQYRNVRVFHSGPRCRTNIGAWPTRAIVVMGQPGTRAFYTAKDVAMAREATCGLMLWDMRSSGTLANVVTLLQEGKQLLLYLVPRDESVTLRTLEDLAVILADCPTSIRTQLQHDLNQVQTRTRVP